MAVHPFATSRTAALKRSCETCSLSSLCLPLAVDEKDLAQLEDIVQQGRAYQRGESIFRQNGPAKSFFAVRSGAIKTSMVTANGEEQVTGFYLPGELIGLDSLSGRGYACTARALEHSSVCELPIDQLEGLSRKLPALQHHFLTLMSQEIQNGQHLSLLLSKNSAEERIASLLLSLSTRFRRRKLSSTRFQLPMPRADIANFLGLAVETVSRVMTRFQQTGLIQTKGRELELLNPDSLQHVAQAKAGSSR